MGERTGGVRRATEAEILREQVANPLDLWYQEFLDLAPGVVGRAACRLWGAPDADGVEGDLIWRLWSDRGQVPVCIVLGPLWPAVLFSDGMQPAEGDGVRLGDEVRRMLLKADRVGGDAVG